jgi:hypothetical protein
VHGAKGCRGCGERRLVGRFDLLRGRLLLRELPALGRGRGIGEPGFGGRRLDLAGRVGADRHVEGAARLHVDANDGDEREPRGGGSVDEQGDKEARAHLRSRG